MNKFIAGLALAASLTMTTATAQNMMEFGSEDDIAYAALLWNVMETSNLAGENAIQTYPYEGMAPHGMMLQTFYTTGTINGTTGDLIVKRNYGPEGVTEDEVLMNPAKHLGAITVMFRREAGYDDDNQDWFWAKFLPDGSLDKNAMGGALAGRVAKGADVGCIACHSGVDDYVFTSDAMTMMK
ncbi:MAG: cytochrome P460 family protein [Rhodobacteraceae bacterium]|nr:cytochrome P460 family protein [Paracoccaceae bacterium]